MHEHHKLCFKSEADRIIFALIYASMYSINLRNQILGIKPSMFKSSEEADCWYYSLKIELEKMHKEKQDRADTVLALRQLSDIHAEMLHNCADLIEIR